MSSCVARARGRSIVRISCCRTSCCGRGAKGSSCISGTDFDLGRDPKWSDGKLAKPDASGGNLGVAVTDWWALWKGSDGWVERKAGCCERGVPNGAESGAASPPNGVEAVAGPPNGAAFVPPPPNGAEFVAAPPNGVEAVAAPPNGVDFVAASPNGVELVTEPPKGVAVSDWPPNGA